jgi:uncharacterized protein
MSERDGFDPGVPCWVHGVHPDPEAAASFYSALFGWEVENLMPPDHPERYLLCKLRGRDVAAFVSNGPAPPPARPLWGTHVSVESADDAAAKATDAGGTVIAAPFDSPGGGRIAVLADPAGAAFCAWAPRERSGAQVVNEPGAWAMSFLLTPDPGRAMAFYGALFGWTIESFGDEITLFRVPGYEGGEPEQPVSREVVAGMMHTTDGSPSRWNVDFWVDDVDATAATATARGGSVVTEPYDVPGFRQAVLADPQGAPFTVSKVTPHAGAMS